MEHNTQEKNQYLKQYKELHYSKTRKIVTFPLLNDDYALLAKASSSLNQVMHLLKILSQIFYSHIMNR
jgi:hypothetical protein